MSDSAMTAPNNALAAKQAQEKSFRKKGIFIALMSGFLYGGYTAFMTQGMATGVWVDLLWWNRCGSRNLCIRTGLHAVCSRCGSKRYLFRSMDSDLRSDHRKTG